MKRTSGSTWGLIIAATCAAALAGYIFLGQEFKFMLNSVTYHRQLLATVLQGRTFGSWVSHAFALPAAPHGEWALTLTFLASCLAAGIMCWALMDTGLDFGPTVCLFSFAAAIVPPLFIATVFWPDGRGHITSPTLLGAGLVLNVLLGIGLIFQSPKRRVEGLKSIGGEGLWGLVWIFLFLVPLAAFAIICFLNSSIGIKGYDALAYHLPLAAAWYKTGRLVTGADVQYFLPGNMELIMRWVLAGFSDRYAFLAPFCSYILSLYIIYKISRAIGQTRSAATVSACLAATFPVAAVLSTEASSDMTAALFMLLAAFFLVRWVQSHSESTSLLISAGMALGLSAGTKMSGIPPVLVTAIVVVILIMRSRNAWIDRDARDEDYAIQPRRLYWPWIWKRISIFVAPALAGGAFWYLRNLITMGNPLYPISIAGLPGLPYEAIMPGPEGKLSHDNLFGATFVAIVVPALLLWLVLRRSSSKDKTLYGARVIYTVAIGSLLLGANSSSSYLRYAAFAILISFVFAGELWQWTKSLAVKIVIYASFLLMVVAVGEFIGGGYLYGYLFRDKQGAERFNLPKEVDTLPPGRVFNATGISYTYGLMGMDYRHEVISLYRDATPADVQKWQPDYVLLKNSQIPEFAAAVPMEKLVEFRDNSGSVISLWKVVSHGAPPAPPIRNDR